MSAILDRELAASLRAAQSRPPRLRAQFYAEELYIPDGPFKGERFRFERQPFTKLLVDELDDDRWPEVFVCGPSQSGKTLIAHVAPIVYVLAELRRNAVVGVPDLKMVADKWSVDFRPVFMASPSLRLLLPRTGPGSQGGTVRDFVTLTNGAVLRFMTAGGDDTARAGFTAEGGVYVTEAARWSHAGETSVEADPLEQLRARTQSIRRQDRRLLVEGTVTTKEELPWTSWAHSTQSRIVSPCPHCRQWVCPEREHLVGWTDAESELAAAESAWWACPNCGQEITSRQRRESVSASRLLHQGQTIDAKGRICGDVPKTERLFFRWSMFHNLLLEAGDVAPDEWKAAQLEAESDAKFAAEKKLCQFVWAVPYSPPELHVDVLAPEEILAQSAGLPRGELPPDTEWLTIGADCGMYWVHYCVIAWRQNRQGHVVEYDALPVLKRSEGDTAVERREAVEIKLFETLDVLRNRSTLGWSLGPARKTPDRVLIDASWLDEVVHGWARSRGSPFFPAIGRGTGQRAGHSYAHPTVKTHQVRYIGDQYHVRKSTKHKTWYFVAWSDHWKSAVHRAFRIDADQPGRLSLFLDPHSSHKTYTRHLTAEQQETVVHARHGQVETWANPHGSPNHYLDATYLAFVAGHHAGFRVLGKTEPAVKTSATWWQRPKK